MNTTGMRMYWCEDLGRGFLELHDEPTMSKLSSQPDADEYSAEVERRCGEFEGMTGERLYLLGEYGRHACVEDTPGNRACYYTLRTVALSLESLMVETMMGLIHGDRHAFIRAGRKSG